MSIVHEWRNLSNSEEKECDEKRVLTLFLWAQSDRDFFELMQNSADNLYETTRVLSELTGYTANCHDVAERLKVLENRGDELTHGLTGLLNRYFVTPFDRDDILALAVNLDNVVDLVEAAAARMSIYGLSEYDEIVAEFARILHRQGQAIQRAVQTLCERQLQKVNDYLEPIYDLEKQADALLRKGLRNIFDDPSDVVCVIQTKEVYETLEGATDYAKDVADVLRALVINHA